MTNEIARELVRHTRLYQLVAVVAGVALGLALAWCLVLLLRHSEQQDSAQPVICVQRPSSPAVTDPGGSCPPGYAWTACRIRPLRPSDRRPRWLCNATVG